VNNISFLKEKLTLRELQFSERYLWNILTKTEPDGCFMQSWEWADFKELEGYQTFRYGLFEDRQLIGGCIFYFYPHPSQANLLMATGGPILPTDRAKAYIFHLNLSELRQTYYPAKHY
jgi:peptidoglycan pentaglycine glycine transferase (the first glycine)